MFGVHGYIRWWTEISQMPSIRIALIVTQWAMNYITATSKASLYTSRMVFWIPHSLDKNIPSLSDASTYPRLWHRWISLQSSCKYGVNHLLVKSIITIKTRGSLPTARGQAGLYSQAIRMIILAGNTYDYILDIESSLSLAIIIAGA